MGAALLQFASAQNREVLGEYKIAIIGRDQEDTIYQAAHLGAKDAALEMSKKYAIDVELLIATPEASQGGSQPTSLAELFVDEADGFIISPGASDVVASSINFAMQQGQEVIFFESKLEEVEPMAAILADEKQAGRLAGKAILKRLPTQGRVAILTSTSPTPQLKERLDGVRAALGYRRIEKVIPTEPNYHAAIKTIREAEEADRNDHIKGWIFLEDWPLLGMPALPWKPGRLPVVAIQSSPSAFIYTDKGYLEALVVHPYYEWGYTGVVTMVEKLHNDKAPETSTILTQPKVIDWRNLKDYREQWQTWFK
ncbi:sugar ABC transporter substrate-binding protein [Coraliomargarita sinensis]|uniref:sugar ABC transporter substrate-binding protein n=1 Tax=Coraliomargarita sinensis TaxID=2174842 RepID=UPI001E5436F0|nr:substrate-binding domain-containing protein [Coraliomargarita sinensis]